MFVLSQCYFCSPARQLCTTWMASCKWPISPLFIRLERQPKRFRVLTKYLWRIQTSDKGGGGGLKKHFFSALRALVWSKTKRGRPPDPPLSTWYWATLKHFLPLHWCKLVFDDCVCDSPDFSVWWCSIRGGFISTVPRKKWTWQMNGMLRRFNLEMFYQTKMEPTDCFNDEKR